MRYFTVDEEMASFNNLFDHVSFVQASFGNISFVKKRQQIRGQNQQHLNKGKQKRNHGSVCQKMPTLKTPYNVVVH